MATKQAEPAWLAYAKVVGVLVFLAVMVYLSVNGFAFPFGDPSCPGGFGDAC